MQIVHTKTSNVHSSFISGTIWNHTNALKIFSVKSEHGRRQKDYKSIHSPKTIILKLAIYFCHTLSRINTDTRPSSRLQWIAGNSGLSSTSFNTQNIHNQGLIFVGILPAKPIQLGMTKFGFCFPSYAFLTVSYAYLYFKRGKCMLSKT